MYSETTERVTASIPPLSILIEYRQDAWHAKIGPDDNPTAHTVGTFESLKEAKTAVLARITDEFKKDDKVLPPTITWTSVKAMLPESNVNKSVRKVSSEVVPVIIGAVGLVMSLYVWGIGKTPGASLSSVADVLKLSVQIYIRALQPRHHSTRKLRKTGRLARSPCPFNYARMYS